MAQTSPVLALPYLQPSQAQKHVTHNEALRLLDAVTQLSVLSAGLTEPPALPEEGDRHIVAPGATGAWAGQDTRIALYADGAWQFFTPQAGWHADVAPTGGALRFDGTAWQTPALQALPMLGVATTADVTNRLAVAAEATLLSHDGAGHQLKINKDAATDTASLLFQTSWSGRAEMGTAGSDDFALKVSPDGSTWHAALAVVPATGRTSFGPGGAADEFFTFAANSVGTGVAVRNTGGAGGAVFRAIDDSSGADWKFKTTGAGTFKLRDEANSTDRLELYPGADGAIAFRGPVQFSSHSVATLPPAAAAGAGAMVFVSDESGGAVMAFSDGTDWRRVTDRAVVS